MLKAEERLVFDSCQIVRNLNRGEKREREKKEAFIISLEKSETKPERERFHSRDRALLSRKHSYKNRLIFVLFHTRGNPVITKHWTLRP